MNFKKALLFSSLLMGTGTVASGETARQPLLPDQTLDGGYAGLVFKKSKIGGSDAVYAGGQGGWNIHDRVILGVGAWSLVNKIKPSDDPQYDRGALSVVFGGPYVEARLYTWKFLSAVAYGFTATGDVSYREALIQPGAERVLRRDSVTVLESGVSLLVHTTSRTDWEIGYGMQSVEGLDLKGLPFAESGGGTLTIGLRGVF